MAVFYAVKSFYKMDARGYPFSSICGTQIILLKKKNSVKCIRYQRLAINQCLEIKNVSKRLHLIYHTPSYDAIQTFLYILSLNSASVHSA